MLQVPATLYRGGTSKCWLFDADDLPAAASREDIADVLGRSLGFGDARQINGVGGATSTTSKAAIITATPQGPADLSYLFAQVGIAEAEVEFGSNCGNCASAVGLYALHRGIVAPQGDVTEVWMYNENTASTLVARVATPGGVVPFDGDERIPGHAATGVSVDVGFVSPAGRSTGALLPTGSTRDVLEGADRRIPATLVDAGAPACLLPADELGYTLAEPMEQLADALPELIEWRRQAALAMGLATPADPISHAIPKVGLVGRPVDYVTTTGGAIAASDYDIAVRMVSMLSLHPAIGITSAVAIAAASQLAGSCVAACLGPDSSADHAGRSTIRIGTPVGVITTECASDPDGSPSVVSTRRLARRIATALIDLPNQGPQHNTDHGTAAVRKESHDPHSDRGPRHLGGDVRRRHQVARQHRHHGLRRLVRRRLLHARHERQGHPRGVPRHHRPHDPRRHLLLLPRPAQRDDRPARESGDPGRARPHGPDPVGLLLHRLRPHRPRHVLPGGRRPSRPRRHGLLCRDRLQRRRHGRHGDQRRPRRRLLAHLGGRRPGARHRREEPLPHLSRPALLGLVRDQPAADDPHGRRHGGPQAAASQAGGPRGGARPVHQVGRRRVAPVADDRAHRRDDRGRPRLQDAHRLRRPRLRSRAGVHDAGRSQALRVRHLVVNRAARLRHDRVRLAADARRGHQDAVADGRRHRHPGGRRSGALLRHRDQARRSRPRPRS